jgi:hypothetical protein
MCRAVRQPMRNLLVVLVGVLVACGTSSEPTVAVTDAMTAPPETTEEPSATLPSTPAAPTTLTVLDDARITSKPGDASYQRVRGDIVLPSAAVAKAKLVVDLGTTCFPFSKWQTEPPPAGQNWPASCDAFDRVFEIAMIDPAIEVVHAATPFGGPMHVEADVTDLVNALRGTQRTFEAYISTFSDANGQVSGSAGGWNVSVKLEIEFGAPPRDVVGVVPIFRGLVTEGGVDKPFPFTLPAGATHARIDYVTSGHGLGPGDSACIGGAEEFCERTHTLAIDGASLAMKKAWRDDCDDLCTMTAGGPGGRTYCKENPCGLPSSVRAPRANWCPGSVTAPWTFDAPGLAAGAHTFTLRIDKIAAPKGSFRVAAHAIAYR